MADEVAPGIFRLPIPLPDSPLGTVNAYAVRSVDGVRLVDCGWNTPEAYVALVDELGALGCGVQDIREILVTHIHPDHFGLAGRLAEESGAPVAMHRLEALYVEARYRDTDALVAEMEAWLRINGAPPAELEAMPSGSLQLLRRVGTRRPDVLLEGGEQLAWGDFSFEVLWTPGHSTGLVCLYEANVQLLISSDHVLQRISPHVGLHAQSLGNPLGDYVSSLRLVRGMPVRAVLPGHGKPFRDLAGRVDELLRHHQDRLATMLDMLDSCEETAYALSSRLSWKGSEDGWERLAPFQRRMALTETIAHLEYLYGGDRVDKHFRGGVVLYSGNSANG